ncbi:ATP-grasp domain-containing protein [Streptomyces sp. NPDC002513]
MSTQPTQPKPRIGIFYDGGSASPVDIVKASRRLCEPVFVVDRDPADPDAAAVPGDVVNLAGADHASAAKALLDLGIEHIITFSDRQLVRTAEVAAAAGYRFLSVAAATACRDKLELRRTLTEAGVDAVRSAGLDDLSELPAVVQEIGLPVVVKPRQGAGSVDTVRLDTVAQAERWSAEQVERIATVPGTFREFVVEELLVGDSTYAGPDFGDFLSVESVVEGTSIRHLCVTGKFPLTSPFRECGLFVPSTVAADVEERCRELAEAAIRALGIDLGVVHTEMKLTPTGPRIIEVNGRPPGYMTDLLRRATGGRYDMTAAALRMALGLPAGDLPALLDQVTYVYFVQPPQDATRLVSIAGPDAVAPIPHVRRYQPFVEAGSPIDWRWGTSGHIGLILGEAADHRAALTDIDTALTALRISYA